MKNINILLVLLFSFFSQIGNSQINPELITKTRGKYYYKGKIYFGKQELIPIYKTNPKAYKAHKQFIGTRRTHRVLTLASIAAIVRLEKWKKERPGCVGDCIDYIDFEGPLVSLLVYAGSTIIILGTGIPVYNSTENAMKVFNEEVLSSSKVGSIPPNINFQTSQDGIGLVLNF